MKSLHFLRNKSFSSKISHYFAFRSLAKIFFFRESVSPKMNFREIKDAKISQNKHGREIINYDIIKLLMLSSQSREFNNQFCAIYCCSYIFVKVFVRWKPQASAIFKFFSSVKLSSKKLSQTLQKSNVQKPLRIPTRLIFRENIFFYF